MISNSLPTDARILIVDDQEANVRLLRQILGRAGYKNLACTQDPREVLGMWDECPPDLVLLDLHMSHLDGFAVMEQLKSRIASSGYVPVLVLTADMLPEAKKKALTLGAKDFLSKPFDVTEVLLRINNLLETRFLYRELQVHNETLEEKVLERTRALEEAQIEMLERLALASEFRDDDTGEHTRRVGRLAAALARLAGWPEAELDLVRRAAMLHDIGKIGIPDRVLLKPGKLTTEEFDLIKTHTALGSRILAGSRFRVLQLAEAVACYHHEKWNGQGYLGIIGEAIPLVARIVAVADVFDVLTHSRPYKTAWPVQKALDLIDSESGKHFDPRIVDCMNRLIGTPDLVALGIALDPVQAIAPEPVAVIGL
jgi:putative two-component system response regulator